MHLLQQLNSAIQFKKKGWNAASALAWRRHCQTMLHGILDGVAHLAIRACEGCRGQETAWQDVGKPHLD